MSVRLIPALCSAGFLLLANATVLAQDVRVIVGGEIKPGIYGRVEVGTSPPPVVVYPRPVVITPPVVVGTQPAVIAQPVYMHVPPGHAKNWRKHCHRYNACGQPVYFVKSAEYDRPAKGKGHGNGHGKGNPHN